ncbi:COG2133 Glucose sorbosone dehydrogenases [Vibrio sp. B1FLJ16]|uniref:PQQ-dependent sugar dehydrogenase n=1 Tax=Vibrio sp. B1FLJ16 TaxID=2751178 RepID=UPI0015F4C982|nr:PQQ-dependent sugar dehydrogenase [Vibrio sp. B1FLJ16]CAD7819298.1 COG2133 Glucose sorbosone dehydrogenases [Vibrio sp. B1FLJ16]CAE6938213.1 COG2133 Glucose sorbosone dehydrogenases [Vibrio sp. B1FLJ16]
MRTVITTLLACLPLTALCAQYEAKEIANGFQIPWGIEFLNSKEVVVNEKNGTISLLNIESGKRTKLYSVSDVNTSGQAGLLDVALAPNADKIRPQLFFTYSKRTSEGNTVALATATLENNKLVNWNDLLVADAVTDTGRHFGSRIAFVDDKVYFSIGDRGELDNGQNRQTHAGSILRLNLDGSVPADNPFKSTDARPEIWSYGHRNPQGLFYDEATHQLWSIEHGPRGGDEINLIKKGSNYGWARVSQGKEYWGPLDVGEAKSLPEMEDPKLVYIPSIAPSNLVLYRGGKYPDLDGKIVAGALKLTHINVVSVEDGELTEYQRLMEDLGERIRDITISPDGYLYFSTDSGKIFRLEQK